MEIRVVRVGQEGGQLPIQTIVTDTVFYRL